MKIIIFRVLLAFVLVGQAMPKCINPTHATEKTIRQDGQLVKTNTYFCAVKRSEKQNFNEQELCKNCGCYIGSHDDT